MKYYSKDKVLKMLKECLLSGKLPNFPVADFVKEDDGEFQEFVDRWYELFPNSIKSGNFYVKTGKKDCFKKLGKFIVEHPEYSKETIIEATQRYINSCKAQGYKYMKLAPYFIYKDDISMLEGYCQQVISGQKAKETKWIITENDNPEEYLI